MYNILLNSKISISIKPGIYKNIVFIKTNVYYSVVLKKEDGNIVPKIYICFNKNNSFVDTGFKMFNTIKIYKFKLNLKI